MELGGLAGWNYYFQNADTFILEEQAMMVTSNPHCVVILFVFSTSR